MQMNVKGQKITCKLTVTECRQLRIAADILRGIAHVDSGAAQVSREVSLYSEQPLIIGSNGQDMETQDDQVATDAAEKVLEQSPSA